MQLTLNDVLWEIYKKLLAERVVNSRADMAKKSGHPDDNKFFVWMNYKQEVKYSELENICNRFNIPLTTLIELQCRTVKCQTHGSYSSAKNLQ